ncbi:GGDEF domain-containing protein [Tardiphaga alba]|uniref:GGDEF domain-containing protein n=1 Tax=Tardiphaga alba TaxID=340268 RepID=A0ABX8AEH4_9BRAD|nr:GGDEF domain-containing protein [Tardiphaga alba]QUS42166.1 GGDEF domain-containing protein [Tardiphaga alba]
MKSAVRSSFRHPSPQIRRELIEMLYTSLPQVAAIGLTSVIGAVALATMSGDVGYTVISFFILGTAAIRLISLGLYDARAATASDTEVVRWEWAYGICAAAFGTSLGMLSFRALQLGDEPGAWLGFGLSMSFCVGMVSRAAIRPWIVLVTAALLLGPTVIGGFMRPEPSYKIGAGMLLLFWLTLSEASRHLSTAFIERLEAKHALAQQARQDFLTGLPNRAAFVTLLQNLRGRVAIVAIDLDGFKAVNDRHGHHAGDELLRQVATRLTNCMGGRGMACRFGGDEFMLLQTVENGETGRETALSLAREAVVALSLPYLVVDIPVRIGASAGILVTGAMDHPEATTSDLLEQVDRALYAAKRAGGGRWKWSDEDLTADTDVRRAG